MTASRGPTELDRDGRGPLHYAPEGDDVTTASALLAAGADPNLADRTGWTPLHFAAQQHAVGVGQLLLAAGADVDPQDRYGNTPLHTAVFQSRGRGEFITLLRDHGADPFKANHTNVTPVGLARTIGNFPVAQWFADLPASD